MVMNKIKFKMKQHIERKFLIIFCGLIFLFHSCKWMNNKNSETEFAVSDTASIQKIFIADKANHTITLE